MRLHAVSDVKKTGYMRNISTILQEVMIFLTIGSRTKN